MLGRWFRACSPVPPLARFKSNLCFNPCWRIDIGTAPVAVALFTQPLAAARDKSLVGSAAPVQVHHHVWVPALHLGYRRPRADLMASYAYFRCASSITHAFDPITRSYADQSA